MDSSHSLSRRQMLLGMLIGGAGLALAACGEASAPASSAASGSSAASPAASAASAAASSAAAKPAASASASGAASAAASGASKITWEDLLAAGKKEGKVVVSGPPDPEARTKLPAAFKDATGIEMEYLGGNTSQLAARIDSERAAGQYTIDVSVGGSDTMYGTFLPKKWIEPFKDSLVMPDVVQGKWAAGGPWFRDPDKNTILQLFNTVQPMMYLNLSMISPKDLPNADALLDPKWKGKICAYDPAVNGAGIAVASALYVAKGEAYATKLYDGQKVVLSRDYQQIADWLGQGTYPIAMAAAAAYLAKYVKAGVKLTSSGAADFPDFPDASSSVGGGFSDVAVYNKAPHPNAARVFANWIASKDALSLYSQLQLSSPARTDIDASKWLEPNLIPKPGVNYLDTYSYEYETTYRLKIRDFYNKLLK